MEKAFILDKYEQEIEDNFHEHVLSVNAKDRIEMLQQAAKTHNKRKKPITIRVHEVDLEAIKIKASKIGVPYQTYINILIHRNVTNQE